MSRHALRAAIVSSLFALPSRGAAFTWNVNPQGTGDAPTIQAAFDQAVSGDTVLLAPGTYTGLRQRLVDQAFLTKAIAFPAPGVDLTSSGGASVTFLDAEFQGHCIAGSQLAMEISGITFLRGVPEGEVGAPTITGGGAYLRDSEVTVTDCVFHHCVGSTLTIDGASALYFDRGTSGVVRRCLFRDNYAGDIGGAVGFYLHDGATVENNTFVRNQAEDGGGALYVNDSSVVLNDNIFAFNTAVLRAGAVLCLNAAVLSGNCNLFWSNTALTDPDMTASCSFLGQGDNIVADPLFCGIDVDDFTISASSPAAPGDLSGCGLRGALPVACGSIHVVGQSWGKIKGRYRTP